MIAYLIPFTRRKVINKKLVPMVHFNLKTTDSLKKSPLEVKKASKS